MDDKTHTTLRNTLINGGPPAYVVIQLKLHDYPVATRHYFNAPLPLLTPQSTPLPAWLRHLVYVDRLDLVVEEQQLHDIGAGAAPADALLYLLSAPSDRLSEWNALRGPAAHATLARQGDWLLASERQQLLQLLDCRPIKPKGGQFHSLQLLQVMLRQWLLRQAYTDLLTGPLPTPFADRGEYHQVTSDLFPGQTMRAVAHRRFPAYRKET